MDYVVTGMMMIDVSVYGDSRRETQIGGIPLYGYCGIAPYTDSIDFVARVGKDFFSYYNPWFSQNNISPNGLNFVCDKMPYDVLTYGVDGAISNWEFCTGNWKDAEFFRPHKADMCANITPQTKGFYVSSGPEPEVVWDGVFEKKKQGYDFGIIWEPNGINTIPEKREGIIELLKKIQVASFSLIEGLRIFGLQTEWELITFLQSQPTPLILLRVGARGLYTITSQAVVFVPSAPLPEGCTVMDVTGCGNASTAAAGYAWCEGYDQIMTGIMANVASMYNLLQLGPYPAFSTEMRRDAMALAKTLYDSKKYKIITNPQDIVDEKE